MTDPNMAQNGDCGPSPARPERRERTFLRPHERDALLALVPDPAPDASYADQALLLRDRAILSLFVFAGLRRNELRMLDRRDVDLREGTIFVRYAKRGKTRSVPLHPIPEQAIRAYLTTRLDLDPALFISQRRQRIGTKTLWNVLNKYLPGLESEKQITLHSLRRTFATAVFRKTKDIQVVQRLLGHSNIQTTLIYIQLVDDELKDAVNQL
jgi:integrase/recombinase XerD